MSDRNKFLEWLTPDNCAMLLIDLQTAPCSACRRSNSLAFCKRSIR